MKTITIRDFDLAVVLELAETYITDQVSHVQELGGDYPDSESLQAIVNVRREMYGEETPKTHEDLDNLYSIKWPHGYCSSGERIVYRNFYHCDAEDCDNPAWEDEWSCMCNDKCPSCNAEIEPYKSKDLE